MRQLLRRIRCALFGHGWVHCRITMRPEHGPMYGVSWRECYRCGIEKAGPHARAARSGKDELTTPAPTGTTPNNGHTPKETTR